MPVYNKRKMLKELKEGKKRSKLFFPMLLYVALYLICALAVAWGSVPDTVELEVGAPCPETITAPQNIVDEYTTELLRQEEMQKVKPVYKYDDTVLPDAESRIQEAFSQAEQIRVAARQRYLSGTGNYTGAFDPADVEWATVLTEEDLTYLAQNAPDYFTEQNIFTAAAMEQDKLVSLRDSVMERVRVQLNQGIVADDISTMVENIRSGLISSGLFSAVQADLAVNIVSNNVRANMVYDNEATEAAKQAAAEAVAPVEYKKGQNIVQKGEILSESQYQLIRELGLASDDQSILPRWIVSFLLLFLVFGVFLLYAFLADRTLIESMQNALSVFLLTVLGVAAAVVCRAIDTRLLPSFLPAIIGAAVLKRRTALTYSCFVSVIIAFVMAPVTGFLFSDLVLRSLLAGLLGSAAAVLVLVKKQHRGEYVLAGLLAGGIAAVVYITYGIMDNFSLQQYFIVGGFGLMSGLFCGLLSVGVLPIWEAMFSLATPSKLLELSNPSNELLKRLMVEAPGTYHHSVMTANLAEAGAEAVGADALLARVAAYYHDIGKLKSPLMFKENQMHMKNPHDDLKPLESADIIISHVENGVALAEKFKLPERIRHIIREHHGDSTVSYFYYMAKQQGEVDKERFRYPGPKPASKESGVVMLADVVEAAVRANDSIRKGNLVEQIEKLIQVKYDDGQLDNCPLNRRDLKHIAAAFVYVLEGANHERIQYPEDEK